MVCEEPEGGGCRSKSFVHLWISMVCECGCGVWVRAWTWVWGVGVSVGLGVSKGMSECGYECERGCRCG